MNKLLPYETIVKAHEGDPDAIDTVLSHYAGYTRNFQQVRFFVKFALQLHEMKLLRSYVIDGRLVSIILSIALS